MMRRPASAVRIFWNMCTSGILWSEPSQVRTIIYVCTHAHLGMAGSWLTGARLCISPDVPKGARVGPAMEAPAREMT